MKVIKQPAKIAAAYCGFLGAYVTDNNSINTSLPDCRTCQYVYMNGCVSYDTCVDADKYTKVIPLQFWKSKE